MSDLAPKKIPTTYAQKKLARHLANQTTLQNLLACPVIPDETLKVLIWLEITKGKKREDFVKRLHQRLTTNRRERERQHLEYECNKGKQD